MELSQKIAPVINRPQIVPKRRQMRNLQRNQINVRIHGTCNLLGGIVIIVNIVQNLIAVQQNLRRHNIGFILGL